MGAYLITAAVLVLLQSPPADTTQPNPTLRHRDTVTAAPTPGLAFERLSDLLQYNRVQGLSLGVGYRVPVPGLVYTAGYATIRYGFSDERVTGRLSLVRDSPNGRLAISGYHDIADLDPFSPGRDFPNTFNSLLAGHDDGDYALADGGTGTVEVSVGPAVDLSLTARVEHQHSTARAARSAINDFFGGSGRFPPNPPIKEGVFGGVGARLSGARRARWSLALDVLGGTGQTTARLYGNVRRSFGGRREITIRIAIRGSVRLLGSVGLAPVPPAPCATAGRRCCRSGSSAWTAPSRRGTPSTCAWKAPPSAKASRTTRRASCGGSWA